MLVLCQKRVYEMLMHTLETVQNFLLGNNNTWCSKTLICIVVAEFVL